MSFQKFKSNAYCIGGRHRSGTTNIVGKMTYNKETVTKIKFSIGKCMVCDKRKSMIVSDNVIQAESLGSFFQKFGDYFG